MPRPYITNRYESLKSHEGHEIRIDKWLWNFEEMHVQPARAWIRKDYPNTVLFELEYAESHWGAIKIPPRRIVKLITKAALATGDIVVTDRVTGERLTGQNIAKFIADREEDEICRQLMKL